MNNDSERLNRDVGKPFCGCGKEKEPYLRWCWTCNNGQSGPGAGGTWPDVFGEDPIEETRELPGGVGSITTVTFKHQREGR